MSPQEPNQESVTQRRTLKAQKEKQPKRKDIVNKLNESVQKEYGAPLPKQYQDFLVNWDLSTLSIGGYKFFGFNLLSSQKKLLILPILIRSLINKQNGFRLSILKLLKKSTKKVEGASLSIQNPFCIATKDEDKDDTVYYCIDLEDQGIESEDTLPVYKMNKKGNIELCAADINHFLETCKLVGKRKRVQLDSDESDKESGPSTGKRKK